MSGAYQVIEFQTIEDDDIYKKEHLGMMEYFMKHIYDRGKSRLWHGFMGHFEQAILIDEKKGFVYLKILLCYIASVLPGEDRVKLIEMINKENIKKKGGNAMRTIADSWGEECYYTGKAEGKDIWLEKGVEKVAINMI